MEYLFWIGAMILAGTLGGLAAGLLGVGGGIVIVPILYIVLSSMAVEPGLAMKVAVATSLASIIFTSLSSARSHHRRGAVDLILLRSWSIPIFTGVIFGTVLAGWLDGTWLTLIFAVVAVLVATNMFLRANAVPIFPDFPGGAAKVGSGIIVGTISALMGIGGGTLGVPILTAFGYDIRRAVGTAAALGFIIAIPGAIGYSVAGWSLEDKPPGSLGYVNLIGLAALVPLTVIVAPLGARLAHKISKKALSYSFAAFLLLVAARMFFDLALAISS